MQYDPKLAAIIENKILNAKTNKRDAIIPLSDLTPTEHLNKNTCGAQQADYGSQITSPSTTPLIGGNSYGLYPSPLSTSLSSLPAYNAPPSLVTPHAYFNGPSIMREETAVLQAVVQNDQANKSFKKVFDEQAIECRIRIARSLLSNSRISPLPNNQIFDPEMSSLPGLGTFMPMINAMSMKSGHSVFTNTLMFLGAVSHALRGCYEVEVEQDWVEPTIIFVMILLPTGYNKSLLIDVWKQPFKNHLSMLQKRITQEMSCYKEADILKNMILRKRRRQVVDAFCAANENDENFDPQNDFDALYEAAKRNVKFETDRSIGIPQFFMESGSFEKIASTMASNGECLGVFDAEAGFLQNMLGQNKTGIELFLKGYTMESYSYQSMKAGAIYLDRPCIPGLVALQPDRARKVLRSKSLAEAGVLSRLLPYFPNHFPFAITTGNSPVYDQAKVSAQFDSYDKLISTMLSRNYCQKPNRTIHTIRLTSSAREVLYRFKMEATKSVSCNFPSSVAMDSFMRKLAGTAVRFAGLIHTASYGQPESYEIHESHMHAGIQLAYALIPHAERAFGSEPERVRQMAVKIFHWLVNRYLGEYPNSDRVSIRKISQSVRGADKELAIPALHLLDTYNYIRKIDMPVNRSAIYALHPDLRTCTQRYDIQATLESGA